VLLSARQSLPGLGGHQVSLEELRPDAAIEVLRQQVGDQRVSAESSAAADIALHCGYLPLALRIAGARLALRPSLRLATFAQRLGDERRRLDELKTTNSEVRAALRLGIQALDESTRDAFQWLGVLEGPDFPTWRLAALLDADEDVAEARIESLLQRQVVAADSSGDGLWEHFRMHDLMRLSARELLEEETSADIRAEALRRVSRSFLYLANRAASALEPGEDFGWLDPGSLRVVDDPVLLDSIGSAPLTWFSVERQTLVIAIERLTTLDADDLVIGLARSITTFFDYHAHWDDWAIIMKHALASARASHDSDAEAALLRSEARLYRYRGELDTSRDLVQASLALARKTSNGHAVAESLIDSIRLDWYQGRHADAHAAYDEATDWFASAANSYGMARCRASIALVLRDEGQVDDAVKQCEYALEAFRKVGDLRWIAATLTTLADLLLDQQRPREAEKCVHEALPLLRALNFRWWEAVVLRTLGLIHAELGRLPEAEECLRSVVSTLNEFNLEWWESVARVSLADVLGRSGRHAEALEMLGPAATVFEQGADRRWSAITVVLLARLVFQDGGAVEVDKLHQAVAVLAVSGEQTWKAIGESVLDEISGAESSSG
jgi:tetratricopeptide (TPR) repeat protein